MLDSFEILTTSGVVIWSKTYAPVGVNIINSLIKDVFIEENVATGAGATGGGSATKNPPYRKEKYTLKWTAAKDLGLIFVAVYQSLLHLSWIDKLLDNVKTLFTTLYGDKLKKLNTTKIDCPFDGYFERQIQELEKAAGGAVITHVESRPAPDLTPPSSAGTDQAPDEAPPPMPELLKVPQKQVYEDDTTSAEATPIATPDSSRPASPASNIITAKMGPGGKQSRRARKAAVTSHPTSREASASEKTKSSAKPQAKVMRKWDGSLDEGDDQTLDYSKSTTAEASVEVEADVPTPEVISQESWATKTGKGEVVLRDLDEEMDAILSFSSRGSHNEVKSSTGLVGSSLGALSGLFRNVVGGKTLTEGDLAKPLKQMEEHLVQKNVARSAALRLCEAVSRDLVNTKTASFQSIDTTIREAMERALSKILTPTSSLDLLRAIQAKSAANTLAEPGAKRPYVISIVGVNGVGKSTTIAKLAFLLLHNNLRVLLCGSDTFRSGAVEQLRVHCRNLQSLTSRAADLGRVDLYERGYGKDPAHIARDAVAIAAQPSTEEGRDGQIAFDVVLIDTAGRRHNDSRLMASLEGFARLARPDKIFMVGEALVGNDSVEQAKHFNSAFGPGRGLDGFIVSKCDTVGDMVGTIVSMVHATSVPVVAVGVGQHYGDLRTLNVGWATRLLMT